MAAPNPEYANWTRLATSSCERASAGGIVAVDRREPRSSSATKRWSGWSSSVAKPTPSCAIVDGVDEKVKADSDDYTDDGLGRRC